MTEAGIALEVLIERGREERARVRGGEARRCQRAKLRMEIAQCSRPGSDIARSAERPVTTSYLRRIAATSCGASSFAHS